MWDVGRCDLLNSVRNLFVKNSATALGGLVPRGVRLEMSFFGRPIGWRGAGTVPPIHSVRNDLKSIKDEHVWAADAQSVTAENVIPVEVVIPTTVREGVLLF